MLYLKGSLARSNECKEDIAGMVNTSMEFADEVRSSSSLVLVSFILTFQTDVRSLLFNADAEERKLVLYVRFSQLESRGRQSSK